MQTPQGPLKLDVYPGDDCRGQLYFDDGVSVDGPSLRQTIRCSVGTNGVVLSFGPRKGSWRPWWKRIDVTVHGAAAAHRIIPDQQQAGEVLIPTVAR
jgi:alpha-glucosidase